MKDQRSIIITGPATDTVPGDCDSVMILRHGVVSEIRPIWLELTPLDESEAAAMLLDMAPIDEFDAAAREWLNRYKEAQK